jgi:hypothetical protein
MIAGIDPGKAGAIALNNGSHHLLPLLADGKTLDVEALQDIIISENIRAAYVEAQHIRARQGGNFTTASNYGRLTAVLDLCGVTWMQITPQMWQKALGLSGDKAEHIAYAEAHGWTIPMSSHYKNAKPLDGVADAACILLAGVKMEVENE